MNLKPLNMYIPSDLKLSFKLETTKENKSMVEVVTGLIKQYLVEKQNRAA